MEGRPDMKKTKVQKSCKVYEQILKRKQKMELMKSLCID
jgi:hypothetical protein